MRRIALSTVVVLLSSLAFAQSDSKKSESSDQKKHRFTFRMVGGHLGIEALPISQEVRKMLGAPEDAGVLVNRVEPNTPAAEAGIKAGDVIVEVDNQKIEDVGDIREALSDKKEGDKVQVAVIHDKSRKTLTATVKKDQWYGRGWPGDFKFDDKAFAFESYGPRLREKLKGLEEKVGELEKKLEKLSPK